jgi:transposase
MTNTKTRKIEVLTEPQRRRRWSVEEKKSIVDETYQPAMSVSIVARKHGIAPNQLFQWRRAMENGALSGIESEGNVVPQSELKKALDRIKRLEQILGRKTEEVEILKEGIRTPSESPDLISLSD